MFLWLRREARPLLAVNAAAERQHGSVGENGRRQPSEIPIAPPFFYHRRYLFSFFLSLSVVSFLKLPGTGNPFVLCFFAFLSVSGLAEGNLLGTIMLLSMCTWLSMNPGKRYGQFSPSKEQALTCVIHSPLTMISPSKIFRRTTSTICPFILR